MKIYSKQGAVSEGESPFILHIGRLLIKKSWPEYPFCDQERIILDK